MSDEEHTIRCYRFCASTLACYVYVPLFLLVPEAQVVLVGQEDQGDLGRGSVVPLARSTDH